MAGEFDFSTYDFVGTAGDELRNSCNLKDEYSSITIQEEIRKCFEFIKTFINNEDFVHYVRNDSLEMKDIEVKLDQNIRDLKRTDWSIVFAGETSSGKSSIANEIIREKILPTGIEATTTRVCRVKYAKERKISTCGRNGKESKDSFSFRNTREMTDKLKDIDKTNDRAITYVDIFTPTLDHKENLVIVDTPGIGDIDQQEVVKRTMDYLPNALAFVFVINVAAAGGLQKDRFIPIMDHVKASLDEMVSFNPKDVIFLLNKWDTLLDDDEKLTYYKKIQKEIQSIWKEVGRGRILRLSMNKAFGEHGVMFQSFKMELDEVIKTTRGKRLKIHMGFLRRFVNECERVVSLKLELAEKNAEKCQDKLDAALTEVLELEKIWQEETLKLNKNMEDFFDAVMDEFYKYINHPEFKNIILKNVETSWRLIIDFDVNAQIEKETKMWEEKHVNHIFMYTFVKNIHDKLRKKGDKLANNLMKGFTMPFDPENKILFAMVLSTASVLGGAAITGVLCEPPIAVGVALSGIVFTGLLDFGFVRDFKTVCDNAVKVRIESLTKTKIKQNLKTRYTKAMKTKVNEALVKMKEEIDKLKEEQEKRATEKDINASIILKLMPLDRWVFDCKQRFDNIVNMCANMGNLLNDA